MATHTNAFVSFHTILSMSAVSGLKILRQPRGFSLHLMDSLTPPDMQPGFTGTKRSISMLDSTTAINTKNFVRFPNPLVISKADLLYQAAFLYGNYRQVGQILEEAPSAIAGLQSGQALEDTAYRQHIEAERMYLLSRKKEGPQNEFACDYYEHLISYQESK
jgi:hypothetical protein